MGSTRTVAAPEGRKPAKLAEPDGDVVFDPLVGRVGEDRVALVELDQRAGAVAGALSRLGCEESLR
jgi:hypothetical protein